MTYDTRTGQLAVWRGGTYLGSWTDPTPLTSGGYISLRTDSANVSFDSLIVLSIVKYYTSGGQRIALRRDGVISYLLTDHLGSTRVTTDAAGAQAAEMKYYPFGATRYNSGGQKTTYRFTGQRFGPGGGGLYDYGARWYDSTIGRFIQADSIVPNLANPQSLNRYSYVRNNPTVYIDPTGQAECRTKEDCDDIGAGTTPMGATKKPPKAPGTPASPVPTTSPAPRPVPAQPGVPTVVQQVLVQVLDLVNDPGKFSLQYDANGDLDLAATLNTTAISQALYTCALAVSGTCGVAVVAGGYLPGMGGGAGVGTWVAYTGDTAATKEMTFGGYLSPNLAAAGLSVQVTILPGAQIVDIDGGSVQAGGSAQLGPGIGVEVGVLKTDRGTRVPTIAGAVTLWGTPSLEAHAGFSYNWIVRYDHIRP